MTRTGAEPIDRKRCSWCTAHELYRSYHDEEWGVPLRDSRALYELLCLEGAQAGLSWWTILQKREAYRKAFRGFEPARVARMTAKDVDRLVQDPGIVRHRGKIEAVIGNARAYLALESQGVGFADWIWQHAPAKARHGGAAPVTTSPESEVLSKDLKRAGFRFVGPTICYAFMQAAGLVNDHQAGCWRRQART